LFIQIIFLSLILCSCATTKKTKYFQDIPDSGELKKIPAVAYIEPKIQVDDILSVNVQLVDPLAASLINMGNQVSMPNSVASAGAGTGASSTATLQAQVPNGYLVDKEGNIDLPIIGKVHVVGYSTSELTTIIQNLASKYYNNPSVNVRYANFKITVAGEVARPGIFIMPNEKVTILDAIATAGDLTIFGKRDNVLLIRENSDGTRTPYRVNLKKSDIMSAPYYYLRQNDYIYVEPGAGKAAANDANAGRNYAIISSILTVLIVLISREN
jgi:polysaccharide export outer membrane protein